MGKSLAEFLQQSLDNVEPPKTYDALREKLKTIQPSRKPPVVKQSPENRRRVWSSTLTDPDPE
ncbi:hypothetical protein [Bradyrhizobium sp.]|uniref:hypothetical protein n=1 Tax=Bradyrhizobium sp. TaxID=376 RepID=UPI001EBCF1A9|nr:hypothetical protein [Bradyrhizobium sp.]MBV8920596.1 hypothetical protein [Bradyrhizobium sp.]MBV9978533.1 hypothetical protein [Bradyrhizobium sp.]